MNVRMGPKATYINLNWRKVITPFPWRQRTSTNDPSRSERGTPHLSRRERESTTLRKAAKTWKRGKCRIRSGDNRRLHFQVWVIERWDFEGYPDRFRVEERWNQTETEERKRRRERESFWQCGWSSKWRKKQIPLEISREKQGTNERSWND